MYVNAHVNAFRGLAARQWCDGWCDRVGDGTDDEARLCQSYNCAACRPCEPGQEKEEGGKKYKCVLWTKHVTNRRCIECCDPPFTRWQAVEDKGGGPPGGPPGGGDGGGDGGGFWPFGPGGGGAGKDISGLVIIGFVALAVLMTLR